MIKLTVPDWVKQHDIDFTTFNYQPNNARPLKGTEASKIGLIRLGLQRFKNPANPEVSIVIPAYNEEQDLLRTLSSLAKIETSYVTELIVANNKSTDRTQAILDLCGVTSVYEINQGISYARQAGLEKARGKYILNADCDTIYPTTWVDAMVEPLKDTSIACVYGSYAFIPSPGVSRAALMLHETGSLAIIKMRSRNQDFVNVMGFNHAFRKTDAMEVGGFEHNLRRSVTERSEDGWMGYLLSKLGRIKRVGSIEARVWTSDRRLIEAGSLSKAFALRFKKYIGRLGGYMRPFEHGT